MYDLNQLTIKERLVQNQRLYDNHTYIKITSRSYTELTYGMIYFVLFVV